MIIEGKYKLNTGAVEKRKPGLTHSAPVPTAIAKSKLDGSTHGQIPIKQQKVGK